MLLSDAFNMPSNLEKSAVATGLEKVFSFQSQRIAMPKNVQITAQLQSTHVTVGLCSKSFKLGFKQYVNQELSDVQARFRKTEEPEIKLPTSHWIIEKQESCRKTSASLTMLKPLTVWITEN